jgi:hypothetical protein
MRHSENGLLIVENDMPTPSIAAEVTRPLLDRLHQFLKADSDSIAYLKNHQNVDSFPGRPRLTCDNKSHQFGKHFQPSTNISVPDHALDIPTRKCGRHTMNLWQWMNE